MKQLFTYILIFISTLLLFNCKKYPEGGCERRGPKNIIGDWKLTLYEVNGIDSTELINYNGDDKYKKITFSKEDTRYHPHYYIDVNGTNQKKYYFTSSNKSITIVCDYQQLIGKECAVDYYNTNKCYRILLCPEGLTTDWTVQKITKSEIILTSSQNNNYKIKLSK